MRQLETCEQRTSSTSFDVESFAMNIEVRRSLVIPVELIEELFEKCFANMGCEKSVEFAILNIILYYYLYP